MDKKITVKEFLNSYKKLNTANKVKIQEGNEMICIANTNSKGIDPYLNYYVEGFAIPCIFGDVLTIYVKEDKQ